jgi:hypothetical protein
MAMTVALDLACDHKGCQRIAKERVVRADGTRAGQYCGTHVKAALKREQQAEASA